MNKSHALLFDQPVDSKDHALLRDTAWMGGGLVEGQYLLGMLEGKNLFNLSREEYARRLHGFVSDRVSHCVADVFAQLPNCNHLIPYLRRVYHSETNSPSMPSRDDRLEAVIEYFLNHPDATSRDIATAVGTTEKQIERISELHAIRKVLRLHRNAWNG